MTILQNILRKDIKDKNGYGMGWKFSVLILMISIHIYFFLKSSSWTLKFMHFIICKLYHNKIMIKISISELVNK